VVLLISRPEPIRGARDGRRRSFSISTDQRLLDRFDSLSAEKDTVNRSEAIQDLMRNALVEEEWEAGDAEAVGTVTLSTTTTTATWPTNSQHQHSHHEAILSTLHIHLDSHNCLEVVVLRGSQARSSAWQKVSSAPGRQARQVRGDDGWRGPRLLHQHSWL
jgi:CopG family nickel-responsive transcriptional regulator